jgi:hypothetical protein
LRRSAAVSASSLAACKTSSPANIQAAPSVPSTPAARLPQRKSRRDSSQGLSHSTSLQHIPIPVFGPLDFQ